MTPRRLPGQGFKHGSDDGNMGSKFDSHLRDDVDYVEEKAQQTDRKLKSELVSILERRGWFQILCEDLTVNCSGRLQQHYVGWLLFC